MKVDHRTARAAEKPVDTFGKRGREGKERQTDRQTETKTETDRQRQRERDREIDDVVFLSLKDN